MKLSWLLLAAGTCAAVVAGCGAGDDPQGGKFDVRGSVDRFAGPTPLVSRFSAEAKHAHGKVIYRWRFDDGTTSEQQSATHSFRRAGYYQVILDARDESGNNDRETFLLGAWPQKQWTNAMNTHMTPARARAAQLVQNRRTNARRTDIREQLRRRAAAQNQG
jgi:PKD domain